MPNNAAWDTATTDPLARATQAVSLNVAARAAASGLSGFTAETGFTVSDNNDGTLNIVDAQSRFGAKPNGAKPVYFIDFGNGEDQPHSALSRMQTPIIWSSPCFIDSGISKAGSSASMIIDSRQADSGGSVFEVPTTGPARDADATLLLPAAVNTGRKYYRYYDVYNDFTVDEMMASVVEFSGASFPNFKQHRWQSSNAQTTAYTPNVLQAFEYRFMFSGDGLGGYDTKMYDSRDALVVPTWHREEEYHQVSSAAGTTDASMFIALDGQKLTSESRLNVDSHGGVDPAAEANRWNHYKLGNFRFWARPGDAPWRANLLYVDDSWCRVLITDKDNWLDTEGREQEIQIPVSWASADLDFHFRQGAHSTLAGKYLWVVDNNDTKILIGGWA